MSDEKKIKSEHESKTDPEQNSLKDKDKDKDKTKAQTQKKSIFKKTSKKNSGSDSDNNTGSSGFNAKINLLEKQLAEKEIQIQSLIDSSKRTMAEFDNYRKRTEKEKLSIYNNAVSDTVLKILPVLDNLERAVNSIDDKESNYYKGIEMIIKQFLSVFSDFGVEQIIINSGDDFNHELHCAVAHIEDKNFGENKIVDELEKGYKFKDKVIRYSKVRVAN